MNNGHSVSGFLSVGDVKRWEPFLVDGTTSNKEFTSGFTVELKSFVSRTPYASTRFQKNEDVSSAQKMLLKALNCYTSSDFLPH